jgi:hypothetical protein
MSNVPASNETPQRRATRLALGTAIAFMIHLVGSWPMSHLMPVVVVVTLMGAMPLSLRQGWHIFRLSLFFFLIGGLIAWFLSPWPFVVLLACVYMLYRMSIYMILSGEHQLVIAGALVGFTVVPIATVLHPDLGLIVSIGAILDWGVALLIAPVAWMLIPPSTPPPEDHHSEALPPEAGRELALTLTVVLAPLMAYFLIFSFTKILVMVYSVIFATAFSSYGANKTGVKYLVANSIYACLGMLICYELLVMVPDISFVFPLIFVAVFIYSYRMFLGGPTGAFWQSGIFGFLIMLGGILTKDDIVAASTLMARLWQLVLATTYVTFAWAVVEFGLHLKKKWWPVPTPAQEGAGEEV